VQFCLGLGMGSNIVVVSRWRYDDVGFHLGMYHFVVSRFRVKFGLWILDWKMDAFVFGLREHIRRC